MIRIVALLAVAGVIFGGGSALASPAQLSYSGNGTRTLAPIVLKQPSTVSFTATGGIFMLIALAHPKASGPNPQLIVSQARSGKSYLPPGRYVFKVSSFGSWHMTVKP